MHSTDNLNDGYLGSGKRLWNSLKKHGKENHSIEILEHYDNREDLRNREAELVNDDLLTDSMCMNLVLGGSGFAGDEHTIEASKKGKRLFMEKLKYDKEYRKDFGEKISNGLRKRFNAGLKSSQFNKFGELSSMFGKKHSEEALKKMCDSKKNHGLGEKNSQYGTYWITKDGLNKKIKKEEIDNYLNDGWIKGRK